MADNQQLAAALSGTIKPTPRNPVLGGVADLLGMAYKLPEMPRMGVPGMDFLAANRNKVLDLLGIGDVQKTADALSYGNAIGTGKGMTYRPKDETINAALTVAPFAGKVIRATEGLPVGASVRPIGQFDPRFDSRALEQARLKATNVDVVPTSTAPTPKVSLADYEGRPFITSMSDRTAAGGNLVGINDVALKRPVELKGGQDFMFHNPGQVWASAQNPVNQIMANAQEIKRATGQNPLLLPWRMAPTGGDFASMTGETMLAYADSAMNKTQKRLLDKSIKQYIPDWAGVSDPQSVEQFRNAPDAVRKALKNMMDVDFRNQGGLNIGQARLAVADPAQLTAQDAGVMNVGEIFADKPVVMESGHPSYPRGVPGQGLGQLQENRNVFELLPQVVNQRNIANPLNPGQTDIRALQMKPYTGIISADLLKSLGY